MDAGYAEKRGSVRLNNMKTHWPLIAAVTVLAIAVFSLALSFRYRMVGITQGEQYGQVYVIDNWMGRVWFCVLGACHQAKTPP